MSTFALRTDVEKKYDFLLDKLTIEIVAMKEWVAPIATVNDLINANEVISRRIVNIDKILIDKVDKSEIDNLQVLASCLKSYDHFRDCATHDIANLTHLINENRQQFDVIENMATNHESRLNGILSELSKFGQKSEIRVLAKYCDSTRAEVVNCLPKERFKEVANFGLISEKRIISMNYKAFMF